MERPTTEGREQGCEATACTREPPLHPRPPLAPTQDVQTWPMSSRASGGYRHPTRSKHLCQLERSPPPPTRRPSRPPAEPLPPKPHAPRLHVPATARIANPTRPVGNARLAVPKERNRAAEAPRPTMAGRMPMALEHMYRVVMAEGGQGAGRPPLACERLRPRSAAPRPSHPAARLARMCQRSRGLHREILGRPSVTDDPLGNVRHD